MQITDVKSLESGSVKRRKAEKYQELEKLKKSWKQSKESLKQSVKKREGYFRRAAFAEKDEEEKNAFQYWQMQEKNYKNTSLSTINWTVKNEAMTAVC